MTGALRLIIEHHPAWQRPGTPDAPPPPVPQVPATSQTLYTLLGRRGALWHTVVPRLDTLVSALHAMDSANRSQIFDRLVIAQAKGLSGQPLEKWETCVCAIPDITPSALVKPSFADVLTRAERRQSRPFAHDAATTLTAIKQTKTDASLLLIILFGVALWSQAAPVLAGVGLLCLLETLYQLGVLDRMIPRTQHAWVGTARLYLYSLCAGLIAIPLLAGLMLRVLDNLQP